MEMEPEFALYAVIAVFAFYFVFGRTKKPPAFQAPPKEEEVQPDEERELTEEEAALLLWRSEMKKARDRLIARALPQPTRGPLRGPREDDTDEHELPN